MSNFNFTSYILGIITLIIFMIILDYLIAPIISKIRLHKKNKKKKIEKEEKRIKKMEEKLNYLDTQVIALEFMIKDLKKVGVK